MSDDLGIGKHNPQMKGRQGRKSSIIEDGTVEASILYSKARAKHEAFKANLAELDYKVKSSEYTPRHEVKQASSIFLAAVAQTLRNLPDVLERKASLPPEACRIVEESIDAVLNDLAQSLRMLYEDNKPV
jgi:Protein of unknown function (DUF1441)